MNQQQRSIDLNCDLGEGMETDEQIIPYVSSANIACGYHAGNEGIIAKTVAYCLRHDVAIGAHPGFADKVNFGRKEMMLSETELYRLVKAQVALVKAIAESKGGRLRHVKAHGALYNMAAARETYARVMAQAVWDVDPALLFFGLSNSIMISAAAAVGLATVNEAFADRTYQDDGLLTPRSQPGALLTEEDGVAEQALQMIKTGTVRTLSGKVIPLIADTLCLHGDGAHAVAFAQMIHRRLKEDGIVIQKAGITK